MYLSQKLLVSYGKAKYGDQPCCDRNCCKCVEWLKVAGRMTKSKTNELKDNLENIFKSSDGVLKKLEIRPHNTIVRLR
jgi:hypothetical protein